MNVRNLFQSFINILLINEKRCAFKNELLIIIFIILRNYKRLKIIIIITISFHFFINVKMLK